MWSGGNGGGGVSEPGAEFCLRRLQVIIEIDSARPQICFNIKQAIVGLTFENSNPYANFSGKYCFVNIMTGA